MDDSSFFEYLSPFFLGQLNFIVFFPFLIKYYHILFIISLLSGGGGVWMICHFSII